MAEEAILPEKSDLINEEDEVHLVEDGNQKKKGKNVNNKKKPQDEKVVKINDDMSMVATGTTKSTKSSSQAKSRA